MSLTRHPAEIVEASTSPLLAKHPDWPRVALGLVVTIQNGAAFKSNQFDNDVGVPLIRIRDLGKSETSTRYRGDYDTKYLVYRGQFLVGMDGDFRFARWQGETGLLNQRVCRITPDPEKVDSDFLAHVLPGYLEEIQRVTSSTTVRHLSSRDLARIPIPLPPLPHQRRIAERLTEFEHARSRAKAYLRGGRNALEGLSDAVTSAGCVGRLTEKWRDLNPDGRSVTPTPIAHRPQKGRRPKFSVDLELPELPRSYVLTSVGAVARSLEYGTSKRCNASSDSGIPVLRMGNIQGGRLRFDDLKYCGMGPDDERLLLADGDLLFNRTNSPEWVGKSAVFHGVERMSFASYLIRVRFDPDVVVPEFVNLWINSIYGRHWARMVKTDGVSQSNINGTKLASMPMPLPPQAEQKEIVRLATVALRLADDLSERMEDAESVLHRISRGILSKAFRGELVPLAPQLAPSRQREPQKSPTPVSHT